VDGFCSTYWIEARSEGGTDEVFSTLKDLKRLCPVAQLSFRRIAWSFEMKARLESTTGGVSVCHDSPADKLDAATSGLIDLSRFLRSALFRSGFSMLSWRIDQSGMQW
jgi:hypothetical protein